MERGKDAPFSLLASQPNGHAPSNHLQVNHENRKPLFGNASRSVTTSIAAGVRPRSGLDGPGPPILGRRAKSDPQGAAAPDAGGSPGGSVYLPRKSAFRSPVHARISSNGTRGLQSIRPLSYAEAYKIAQEEEQEKAERQRQLGGSPSPAPRPWQTRLGQPQHEMQEDRFRPGNHLDSNAGVQPSSNAVAGQNDRHSPGAGLGGTHREAGKISVAPPKRFNTKNSLIERVDQWRAVSRPVSDNARAGVLPEDQAELGSDGSLGSHGRLPALVPGIDDDFPILSAESVRPRHNLGLFPDKDFSWQMDHDFTAGDLQISDSPRIRVGANSNKPFANRPSIINDIRARSPAVRAVRSPERSNTRIFEIQEDEVEHGVDNTADLSGLRNLTKLRQERQNTRSNEERHATDAAIVSDHGQPRPKKNDKLDNIRQLETAGLTKRQLADIRLAEIKEQNGMARPAITETPKRSQPRGPKGKGIDGGIAGLAARYMSKFGADEGEQIPDTPVTIYRNHGGGGGKTVENMKPAWDRGKDRASGSAADASVKQGTTDERDLLRRLARATSASPAPEPAPPAPATRTVEAPTTRTRATLRELSSKSLTAKPSLLGQKSTLGSNTNSNTNPDPDPKPKSSLPSNLNASKPYSSITQSSTSNFHPKSFKPNLSGGKTDGLNMRMKDGHLDNQSVGFAGLPRTNSAESVKSKPSSVHSESDPTARIEAEEKLFALADNQSERGSMRAPSIASDSDDNEADPAERGRERKDVEGGGDGDALAEMTPKPQKHDFVTMPTPKVTGAYIETPATEKPAITNGDGYQEENISVKPFREKLKEQQEREDGMKKTRSRKGSDSTAPTLIRDKTPSSGRKSKDEDMTSNSGAKSRKQNEEVEAVSSKTASVESTSSSSSSSSSSAAAAAAAAKKKKPRSRSGSRERPPLKNSAKPPSAKDDLRELQRQHNIDDFTVDDLEQMMTGQNAASQKIKELLEQKPPKADDEVKQESAGSDAWGEETKKKKKKKNVEAKEEGESESQSIPVLKMDNVVRSSLSNIRETKMDIERLEGQIAHVADKKPQSSEKRPATKQHQQKQQQKTPKVKIEHDDQDQFPLFKPAAHTSRATYSHLSKPHLWHSLHPLRLTWLGLILLLLLLWPVAESSLCAVYCRPSTCMSTQTCVYSYDDPTPGWALPIKLDQWTTGGRARKALGWISEDVQDWWADVGDAVRGRTLQDIAVEQVPPAKRRQHWRRLRKRGIGMGGGPEPGPEQRAKWAAWRRARLAKERAREARSMDSGDGDGYGYEMGRLWVDESMEEDERVR
ncbi:hypothetical protein E4U13_001136 [Claviceps humidiphila]|uniref:Uncharacterized protein n=1 Tax=Claviceps humidiphila TaxID=1294629 RepID=A0A9P7Q2S3_9HYPO|nr:hypothetical protein E4U13_001136 [Claviceps humidiphila]